jgi:UDP-N-acetyl-D-mannosaminuronic acid dehydrogenase
MDKKICIIGLGYIGLPTAAILASKGYQVVGVDTNKEVVQTVNEGKIHIAEPDLAKYVYDNVKKGNLRAYEEPQESDIYIICVPTPFLEISGELVPNLEYVFDASSRLSNLLKPGDMIILESTCPVGTTQKVCDLLFSMQVDIAHINIAYCPERVLPGNIINELMNNDRVVGGIENSATKAAKDFYSTFVNGKILETDAKTAELCKLTENSFRDINIAYANELSMICDSASVDVLELISLANRHPRVNILEPGPGVGGHCIAVDPWFVISSFPNQSKLIRNAREVNNNKTAWVTDKIKESISLYFEKNGELPKVACLGLAFKPNIDDLRQSPSVEIMNSLMSDNISVVAVEPNIDKHNIFNLFSLKRAISEANLFVFLVKHDEFIDLASTGGLDGLNFLDFCGIRSF